MFQRLKNTLKHTIIYSLGNIATKLTGIVLLPLYTKYITVAEYGILGILEVTLIILTQVFSLGQKSSFLRFYHLEEYISKRKPTLFTMFIFLLMTGGVFLGLTWILAEPFSRFFTQSQNFEVYLKLSAGIVFLRVINQLFLNVLRAEEKSGFYVIVNLVKLAVGLGLNIYFVAVARLGVKGIMFSFIMGEGLLFLLLFPGVLSDMVAEFDSRILKASLRFGIPLIFSSLAGMLLNVGDRYIIKYLLNYHQVGLYNLGYKIGSVFNVLLIQSFSLGLLPLAYKAYGQEGDKRYYSKMLTYFVFALLWTGLGLSIFSREVIHTFALNQEYWPAYTVVPIIVLAYVFSGGNWVVSLGLFLRKKTPFVAFNNIAVVLLNIGLNFILIPRYKIMGAAVATLVSFVTLYILSYYFSGKFYRIPFENLKLFKMFCLSLSLFFISLTFSNVSLLFSVTLKIVVLILFPVVLYVLKFYEPIEIQRIKEFGIYLMRIWSKRTP